VSKTYDLVILGSGPAGYVGALRASQLGASVAVVEARDLGGLCLNRGCIPTKAVVESCWTLHAARHARKMGVELSLEGVNFGRIISRAQSVVERLRRGVALLLKASEVELFEGRGKLVGPGTVVVERDGGHTELHGKAVLVATGSDPVKPEALQVDGRQVITSDDLLTLKELPERMLIIGAGVTGCEYASMFATLGTKVTVVEMVDSILPQIDEDVRVGVARAFRRQRIDVRTGTRVERLQRSETVVAELDSGDSIEVDLVMVAVGRRFNSVGIGLEEVGVELKKGRVVADEFGRTSAKGIWAAGDVLGGRWLLAHMASRQAINCVEDAVGEGPGSSEVVVPYGVFTLPEVGGAGMTEAEARDAGYEITVGKFPFTALGRAVCADETDGFVKVVAEARSRKLLGIHILGVRAADLIHEGALAIQRGATLDSVIETIHSHPTFAEAVHEGALAALGLALHLPRQQS